MLKTIDLLIGATTVLLLFSMAVTVITQALTTIGNRRGKHLRAGRCNNSAFRLLTARRKLLIAR
jgi:hypothetical protein